MSGAVLKSNQTTHQPQKNYSHGVMVRGASIGYLIATLMLSIGTKVAGEPTVIPFFYQGLYLSMGLTLVAILFNKNFVGCLCFITFLLLFLVVFYPGITNLVEFDLASRESKDLLYAIYFTVTSSLFAYLISKDKWLIQAVYFFRFCRVDYHVRRPSDNSI